MKSPGEHPNDIAVSEDLQKLLEEATCELEGTLEMTTYSFYEAVHHVHDGGVAARACCLGPVRLRDCMRAECSAEEKYLEALRPSLTSRYGRDVAL